MPRQVGLSAGVGVGVQHEPEALEGGQSLATGYGFHQWRCWTWAGLSWACRPDALGHEQEGVAQKPLVLGLLRSGLHLTLPVLPRLVAQAVVPTW